MQKEKNSRHAEVELAYEYLRQKEWERVSSQQDLMRSISVALWAVGVVALAFVGIYAVIFGGL